jgi:4-amino-4-deoxy-L-arabinose transferase-like glycosyltransferase
MGQMKQKGRSFGASLPFQGLLLAAAFLAVLLATAGDVGFARDEGFYFQAARDYQRWFDLLADDPGRAIGADAVAAHWRTNSEHPALMKILFGLSHRVFHDGLGLLRPSTAYRLPGMLAACVAVFVIFVWGAAIGGRAAGFFAAAAFALMPRVFHHAHLACFDVPITAAWLATCYLYWRSLSSRRFGVAAGAVFGVALCIKLNAFFLPLVLGAHYLALLAFRRLRPQGERGPLPRPWAFVWGLVLAPPIFVGHWPWLWHDTGARLGRYLAFHATHAHYNTAYFGENVIAAPTPISLPAVMTAFTVPTTVLLLALAGAAIIVRRHPRDRAPAHGGLALLLALCAVFPIALISLPSVPIFGGTKHWMPAMPFLALLAGAGAARFAEAVADRCGRLPRPAVVAAALALLLAPPLQQTWTSHPFGLASYVPLVGGAPGAADLGLLRQFWGYTTAGVLPFLNEEVPSGGRVYFHDTAPRSVEMFREDGTLRRDIRNSKIEGSDFALVHHELHMIMVDTWIWNEYGAVHPARVLTYQGVPIVSVYENPKRGR